MKTLVKNNKSIYLFEDSEIINITSTNIVIGKPPTLIIGDCNSSNTTLYTQVTPPADWQDHKYFYDGNTWSLNPDWVDPAILEAEREKRLNTQ